MTSYFALIVVVGVLSGLLFWDVYKVMYPATLVLPEMTVAQDQTTHDVSWGPWLDLASSNPPAKKKPAPPPKLVEKPTRQINVKLQLIGIFGRADDGVAIMSIEGGRQQVYAVGDLVKNDVALSEVRLYSILLSAENVTKEYSLPTAHQIIQITDKEEDEHLPQAVKSSSVTAPITPLAQPKSQPKATQQPKRVTPQVKKQIRTIKKQVQDQPLAAAGLGEFELAKVQGQLGVKVKSFKYRDVLIGLGLRPNDIVLSVNGHSITTLSKNAQLASSLLKLNEFQVVIIRNGKKTTVPIKW